MTLKKPTIVGSTGTGETSERPQRALVKKLLYEGVRVLLICVLIVRGSTTE